MNSLHKDNTNESQEAQVAMNVVHGPTCYKNLTLVGMMSIR